MSNYELAKQLHERVTLFQHPLTSNTGELYAWTGAGTPVYGTHYVSLGDSVSLNTIQEFRYGVLTFNARHSDWTQCTIGFIETWAVDHVTIQGGSFKTTKHDSGMETTALALVNNTWYHFIIIWCPQFCSIEVYDLNGALVSYAIHRNPPNVLMNVQFYNYSGAGDTLDVGGVVVQEGDSPIFYLH